MSQKKPPDSDPNARGARPVTTNPRLALVPIKQVAKGAGAGPEKTAESTDPSGSSTDPAGQAPANESTVLSAGGKAEPAPEPTIGGLPSNESTIGAAPAEAEPQPEPTLGNFPEPPPPAPAPRAKPRSVASTVLPAPEPAAPPRPMAMPAKAQAAPAPKPSRAPEPAPPAPKPAAPAPKPAASRPATNSGLRMVAASAEAKAEAKGGAQRTGLLGTLSGLTFGKLMGRGGGPGQPSQSAIFRLKQVAERRGFETIIAGVMVLVAIGVAAHFLVGPSKPGSDQLMLLYPYGASGARLPNGRTAPPATVLSFEYKGTTPCGDEQCLRYQAATPDGAFSMEMVLQYRDGQWALSSNLGR